MGIKELVTGTRPYTSMGTVREGWTAKEVEEEMSLPKPLSAPAWMDKSEFARKCNHQSGTTGKPWRGPWKGPWRGPWKATAITWWVSSQVLRVAQVIF